MDLGIFEPALRRFDILLLIFLRVLGLFTSAPVLSNRLVPIQMRIAIAFGVAMIVSPLFQDPAMPETLIGLVPAAVKEVLVGLIMGFVASLVFSAVQLAGQILDVTMGISIMNVLDPTTMTQMPLLGNLLYITGLLVFFAVGGHQMLIMALMDSYALVPLGTATFTSTVAEFMVGLASEMFIIGIKVAAPVMAALFVTVVALGMLNRAVPQMNVFVIGLPVQLGVGILILAIAIPLYVSFLTILFRTLFDDLLLVLRLLGG